MNMEVAVPQKTNYSSKIHPHKFALWLACASMIMMFAAFTSAYVVRHAAGNWLEFRLPDLFMYSTGIILLSSITLQGSYISFKRQKEQAYKALMVVTFILGMTFLVLQYQGWQALYSIGIELTGNPSGSFVYVISGIHAVHLLAGLAVLSVALIHAYSLKFKITPLRKRRFELTLTFWHFLDFLWVYLFMFFLLQQP